MILIRMAGGFGADEFFGPAPFFELDGEALRQGPERTVIARHVHHAWRVGQQNYSSWEVEGPLLLIAGARTMGLFSYLRVANGFVYGDTRLIAEFDDGLSKWCSKLDADSWPVIELRRA